jgi:DNA transformation protein and related proteins
VSLDSARDRALDIADQLQAMGPITVSRFFGGAGLLLDGVQFAFVIKGALYLRVDDASRAAFEALGAAPFLYAGRSREVTVASYYEVPEEIAEDPDELCRWARHAHRVAHAVKSGARQPRRKSLPR